MPRVRLRRLLLMIILVACGTLVALNVRFREAMMFRFPKEYPEDPAGNSIVRVRSDSTASSFKTDANRDIIIVPEEKPWFMQGGNKRPKPVGHRPGSRKQIPKIWPHEDEGDRIANQLMYLPPDYEQTKNNSKLKTIVLYFGRGGWNDLPLGREVFLRDNCPVNTCELTTSLTNVETADAIFFKDRFSWPRHKRPLYQVWILFLLECPLHTQGFNGLRSVFNWTATYRHDSDIVAPYEKFVLYDEKTRARPPRRNYAAKKTKKVAWFVSNCAARNRRLEYARELSQYIEVDIFGSCGNKRCPRSQAKKCFEMLDRDYKFYLAFENSNCKDYITEKFFVNGLGRDIIPIVMGARPVDYERSAPYRSYIHVEDFESPKALAEYLDLLDRNDTLYNEYFQWKGTGEFINTYFWCRVCALLHAPPQPKVYVDMHKWWSGRGACTLGSWKNPNKGVVEVVGDEREDT